MPNANQPPDADREATGGFARTERLERQRHTTPPATYVPIVFSFSGTLQANVESPPWYGEGAVVLIQARISRTGSSTADTDVEVLVNGDVATTLTLSAGAVTDIIAINIPVPPGNPLTLRTTSQVDGSDLSVIFRQRSR